MRLRCCASVWFVNFFKHHVSPLEVCAQETFVAEVDIMKSELAESDVTVEGEFMTRTQMEEHGLSERHGLQLHRD